MVQKKSFEEKVGEKHAARLIELFLQNDQFSKPTLGEIVALMPEAKFTIGRLAGIRRDHERDIKRLKTAYLVQFRAVPPVGQSNFSAEATLSLEGEEAIVRQALAEWKPNSGFKRFAYAAMRVNQARIKAGVKRMVDAEDVEAKFGT
ncbi:hypothetical protein A3C95_01340 [Candidatus Kaiserbacteria bacterium RIFCSPHIGHO2_02_FULL_56_30]|uniref:Uncharacterized protein n=1 Tax=Candidatus Kaiserbacteria bacterium RIFCSPHIGHO2_02_FULL_56_30 TaxID=1798499 RepID=A0A1F6E4W6_9BACT|nr:MAG: hypothetical protein A3C95_01340 [Candidatus Kaiserbacteria bacterium RIFCSPHIGHO2_02_FULL_56_30]